jgi:hypothetical protein
LTHKRGRRNSKSKEVKDQKQAAIRFADDRAFRDKFRGESVCLTTIDAVVRHIAETFVQAVPEAVPEVEPGLVLRNSIGEGAFQIIVL